MSTFCYQTMEYTMNADTIAAIATAMSPSGIGIIRISGNQALDIIDRIFCFKKSDKRISSCASHTVHYGYIYDEKEMVDEVMVLLMKAPNSYTREDTVEIDCHGGVFVMKRILEVVIKNGARPAEPGEFTKRAFLNGRIDLSQAESVIDVIHAKNDYALQSSLNQLKGSLHRQIVPIREEIIHEIAFIESALDDPEHISLDSYPQVLHNIVDNLLKKARNLLKSFDNGRFLKEGINTVIVGKPNAGKSSLLNILVGEERAIVTDIAGTTRDVIEEQINLGGILLNVMDTAGIRNTTDIVEKIGVDRARENASRADLVIYVIDSSTELDDSDLQIMDLLQEKKVIILLNKADLDPKVSIEEIKTKLNKTIISFSAKEHDGMDGLEKEIKEMFFRGDISFNDEMYAVNARQKNCITNGIQHLELVNRSIEDGMSEDFFSIDLIGAYEEFGKVIGEEVEDDLVEEIFSKFCMGK